MRSFYFLIALGVFVSPAFQQARAAGDVLLPSDNGSNTSTLPNLGLVPTPDTSAAKTVPAAPDTNQAQKPESLLPSLLPAQTPRQTPMPPATAANLAVMMAASKPSTPTKVVQMPPPSPPDTTLPNSVGIDISNYVWGPSDVAAIKTRLGIPPDQVTAHCHLGLDGSVLSDKGYYPFDTGFSPHAELKYDGQLKEIAVRAEALCDLVPLPPNSGYVIQMGDKYAVMLRQIDCPPPPLSPQHIVFQYAGSGKGQCLYQ